MTVAQAWGLTPDGVTGRVVRVEADVASGLPSIGIIGLADTAVGEARHRVRSAVSSAGLDWPSMRVTVGLSPADLPKNGTSLDLPIAVAVLAAADQVRLDALGRSAFLGELGLNGELRGVNGALASCLAARAAGLTTVVLPVANARQAALVPGMTIIPVRSLAHVVAIARGQDEPAPLPEPASPEDNGTAVDMSEVRGQHLARYALEVMAAGGHHGVLVGEPGVGKTMLAERLPTLLPDLTEAEAIEATTIHAAAGALGVDHGLLSMRPFQAPHHSATAAAILGSIDGRHVHPGAVSLAHAGVLFMDEAPEFARSALEGLRQPIESGSITIMRAQRGVRLPARFQLVLAANPCPCGMATGAGSSCVCSPMAKRRYSERLSGPLLDRMDVRLELTRPTAADLRGPEPESSALVRERVILARERASTRFADERWDVNARIPGGQLHRRWAPDDSARALLADLEARRIGMRAIDRVVRVSWTLADLAGAPRPAGEHVEMALALRGAA